MFILRTILNLITFSPNHSLPRYIVLVLSGTHLTLAVPLVFVIAGIALFTFVFFANHSIASSLVGKRAASHKAQASSLYLFFYYTGSSIFGSLGGFFWSGSGWKGVVAMVSVMILVTLVLAISVIRENDVAANTKWCPCSAVFLLHTFLYL
ncbi:hypothetical protein [Terribacillus saccharophilus]|uniref:hypothetical protein n=1 Tax=Terribacillus saccharophilus TaxID=361277 RepID=UPI00148302AB|nr:hypothetical protein [Terribacillus saccharophilus]